MSVGPHCRVRFSTIGAKSFLMPGVQVEWSVLGEKCLVNQNCAVNFCVFYPEAVSGHDLVQLSVLGTRAITTYGSNFIDMNFERDIRVPLDGQLHSIGQRTLGCAVGHRARLGTGFWIASGRMIPNDYFLVRPPHEIISRIPPGLAGQNPLASLDGTVKPVTDLYDNKSESLEEDE